MAREGACAVAPRSGRGLEARDVSLRLPSCFQFPNAPRGLDSPAYARGPYVA